MRGSLRTKNFNISIKSLPNDQRIIVEIRYEDFLWAKIWQEKNELMLELYSFPTQDHSEFYLSSALIALQEAKNRVLSIKEKNLRKSILEKHSNEVFLRFNLKIDLSDFVDNFTDMKRLKIKIANIMDFFNLRGVRLGRFRIFVEQIFKEKLVVGRITYKGIEWAQVLNINNTLTIRFYPHPIQDYWEFNFYESFKVLVIARNAISELNN